MQTGAIANTLMIDLVPTASCIQAQMVIHLYVSRSTETTTVLKLLRLDWSYYFSDSALQHVYSGFTPSSVGTALQNESLSFLKDIYPVDSRDNQP